MPHHIPFSFWARNLQNLNLDLQTRLSPKCHGFLLGHLAHLLRAFSSLVGDTFMWPAFSVTQERSSLGEKVFCEGKQQSWACLWEVFLPSFHPPFISFFFSFLLFYKLSEDPVCWQLGLIPLYWILRREGSSCSCHALREWVAAGLTGPFLSSPVGGVRRPALTFRVG